MGHKASVTDGSILIVFSKRLQLSELDMLLNNVDSLIATIREKNLQVRILADVSNLDYVSLEARKLGVAWLKRKQFDRLAVIANTLFMKHFVNMLVFTTGFHESMRVFPRKQVALNWLWEEKNS